MPDWLPFTPQQLGLHLATATLLGLVVLVVNRHVRHAAVRHALWVIVLLKFLTPPMVELAVLPTLAPSPDGQAMARTAMPLTPSDVLAAVPLATQPAPTSATAVTPISWTTLVVGLLLVGSLLSAMLTIVRLWRFRQRLGDGRPVSPALDARLHRMAARFGVRPPRLRVVDAAISPALWPTWRGVVLLLPAPLLDRLGDDELDAVLAHELAHVRRRDHWIRFLELTAGIVYWWHPLVWWARRALRRAEERSCDAWVTATLPTAGRAYANGLLETLALLTHADRRQPASAMPATATGMNTRDDLEERLTMIITKRTPSLLSPWRRGALVLLALAVLAVLPSHADRPTPLDDQDLADAQAAFDDQRRDLEQQALDLEAQMAELEAQRMALEEQAEALAVEAEREALDTRIRASSAHDETRRGLERERERFEREAALRAEERQLTRETRLQARELKRQARAQALELEALRARGDHRAAEALVEQLHARRQAHVTLEREARERALELSRRAQSFRQEMLERELADANAAGRHAEAEKLRHALTSQRRDAEHQALQMRMEAEALMLREQLEAAQEEAARLLRNGEKNAAEAARERVRALAEARKNLGIEHRSQAEALKREAMIVEIEARIAILEEQAVDASGDQARELAEAIDQLRAKLDAMLDP